MIISFIFSFLSTTQKVSLPACGGKKVTARIKFCINLRNPPAAAGIKLIRTPT